ncbi:MAG: sigma-70 family RNA polymerase sigma factor [Bacteroidota bacterium]
MNTRQATYTQTGLNPEKWISEHYNYLFNYARKKVEHTYLIEELIQETFFSALKSMKNYKQKASERTWLTAILKHKIVDHYRKRNTARGAIEKQMISDEDYKVLYNRELSEDLFFESDYYKNSSYTDLQNKVLADIGKLPRRQADVFTMRVIRGFETETICEKLNITRDNVWVLMLRARRNLSISLGETLGR